MTRPFAVHLPLERAYVRRALFGIELLDAVTLARVSTGVRVVAEGLHATPFLNTSGVFVLLGQDHAGLRKVTIDPGLLPYQRVELAPGQLQERRLTTVELPPRADYAFDPGITGLRGALIERRLPPRDAVPHAEVRLRWLNENGVWRDAPTISRTGTNGSFAAVVRLVPSDLPRLDAGALIVRLRARRAAEERESDDLKLPQGRVADPSTFPQGPDALTFAWDAMKETMP